MSLSAPYSLVPEPDAAIQISKSGTNPFWPDPQTSNHNGQQQLAVSNAAAMADSQNRAEARVESNSNSSYVPPETVLAKTDNADPRRNLDSAHMSEPEDSCTRPGYSTSTGSNSVQNQSQAQFTMHSQYLNEPHRHSFSGTDPSTVEVVTSKKERPQSLQVSKPVDATGSHHQGQKPQKSILKKSSGSVTFDTTVQISEDVVNTSGGTAIATPSTFNDSNYSGIICYVMCSYRVSYGHDVLI